MIVDRIENAGQYEGFSKTLAKAFEILKTENFAEKQDGTYKVDGDNIYYMVQRYTTKPIAEGRLESHKKYIDVQYLVSGQETLGYHSIKGQSVATPYSQENDVVFYDRPERVTETQINDQMFCVFFPEDGHIPCCHSQTPCDVIKVVVKVRYDAE